MKALAADDRQLEWMRIRHERGLLVIDQVGPVIVFGIADADYIAAVAKVSTQYYDSDSHMFHAFVKPWTGAANWLALVDGEEHRRQRKLISPVFHYHNLESMAPIITAQTQHVIQQWTADIDHQSNTPFERDIQEEMSVLSLVIVSNAVFGDRFNSIPNIKTTLIDAVRRYTAAIHYRCYTTPVALIPIIRDLPIAMNDVIKSFQRLLTEITVSLVNARRDGENKSTCAGKDLLDLLLEAIDETTQEPIDIQTVYSNVKGFLSAGADSTSKLISWTIYECAIKRPDIWKGLRVRLHSIARSEPISAYHVKQIPLLDAIIHETLRFRPIAPRYPLEAKQTHTITPGNGKLPITVCAGMNVQFVPYLIHKDVAYWGSRADIYDPSRWLSITGDDCKFINPAQHQWAFIPFGFGHRNCIGQNFALLEAKLVVAEMCRAFDFEYVGPTRPDGTHRIVEFTGLFMESKYGIKARIHSASRS